MPTVDMGVHADPEKINPEVLRHCVPRVQTVVSTDSTGLGAMLLQYFECNLYPVAYASRSLTNTEHKYAQLEKNALAFTCTYEKLNLYCKMASYCPDVPQTTVFNHSLHCLYTYNVFACD